MNMRPGLVFSLFILLPITSRADRVDEYVRAYVAWEHIPGVSIAVMKDGRLVKAEGYGFSNLETTTPATKNTVYKIGSISKQFISACILRLAETKDLSLDDPVTKFLPDAPESWQRITVRNLLNHTAGLSRDPSGYEPYQNRPLLDVIRASYKEPLLFDPGSDWSYSNTGYFVLAQIVTLAARRPWTEYAEDAIFRPSGMSSTEPISQRVLPGRASGYDAKHGQLVNTENWTAERPSGAFLSTVLDFARWDAALNSSQPLGDGSKSMMWKQSPLANGKTKNYGYAWFIDSTNGHVRLHHSGGVPGFSADYERFPDDRLSVVVMSNIGSRDLSDMSLGVAAAYLPALAAVQATPVHDDDPAFTRSIRALFEGLRDARIEGAKFSSSLLPHVKGDIEGGFFKPLSAFGHLEKVELINRQNVADGLSRTYRLRYSHFQLTADFTTSADKTVVRWSVND